MEFDENCGVECIDVKSSAWQYQVMGLAWQSVLTTIPKLYLSLRTLSEQICVSESVSGLLRFFLH